MMATHVAHDCRIGSNVIMANNATLGGHVRGRGLRRPRRARGRASVRAPRPRGDDRRARGRGRDVIPYGSVTGERAHLAGLNLVGLKRRGAARGDINGLRAAFAEMFEGEGTLQERMRARRRAAFRQSAGRGDRRLRHRGVGALLHHPGGLSGAVPGRARHRRRAGRSAAAAGRGLRGARPALPGRGVRRGRRSTGSRRIR